MTNLAQILRSRYRQFGGWKVVRIYAGNGALWPMLKAILHNPFSRQSYKKAYSVAVGKMEPLLRSRYTPVMRERKAFYEGQALEHRKDTVIWFCWLQGMEQAPEIVKICYASLCRHLPDREIKVIDGKNWRSYIELPDYIIEKWEKGMIPPAHFSDLLRLQLLIRYGGTWIDSTVLCTGLTPQNREATLSFLDADLFLFQYTRPGSSQWGGIGNWFISACTNNEVLLVLRDMLYAYWRDYDCMIDYYIFHLFFSMLREVFPGEIAAMPYGYAARHVALGFHWGEPFDRQKWDKLTANVCFHKLTYNVKPQVERAKDSYYRYIISGLCG